MTAQNQDMRQTLDAMYVDRTSPKAQDVHQCFEQIKHDPDAQAHFNALAMADRALGEDWDTPGEFEQHVGELAFLGALDAQLAAEASQQKSQGAKIIPWPKKRIFAAAASLLIVGLGALFAQKMLPQDPQFQARHGINTPQPFEKASISIFCATQTKEGKARFERPEDFEFGVLQCPIDHGHLKLAYTNPYPDLKHMAVFGADAAGNILWYLPNPARTQTVAIDVHEQLQPIGQTIRLNINHKPGKVRVHALFSKQPIDYHHLKANIEPIDTNIRFNNNTLNLPYDHHTSTTYLITTSENSP